MSEIVVQNTADYTKFQKLMANRDLSRKHVNSLKNAISKKPDILKAQPILCNENLFIIDGQHRFQAAVELNMPIYYTIVPGIGIETARAMNILQRRWGPLDFAKSYALGNNKNYKEYLQARQDYEELNHTVILMALSGSYDSTNNGSNSRMFREGDFEVGDVQQGRKNLDNLLEIGDLIKPLPLSKALAGALLSCFASEQFQYGRLIKKLRLVPRSMLHATGTRFEALRMIEEIYNYDMGEKNRLRLF